MEPRCSSSVTWRVSAICWTVLTGPVSLGQAQGLHLWRPACQPPPLKVEVLWNDAAGADGAGDCCASQGCDCSDNSVLSCDEDHYFCPALGVCSSFTDEDACEAAADLYCC